MPVLPLTTSRCVSCDAKIAPVTVLVRVASAPLAACQTLIGHRGFRPGARHAWHRITGSGPNLLWLGPRAVLRATRVPTVATFQSDSIKGDVAD